MESNSLVQEVSVINQGFSFENRKELEGVEMDHKSDHELTVDQIENEENNEINFIKTMLQIIN